jgi:hypothetical protein
MYVCANEHSRRRGQTTHPEVLALLLLCVVGIVRDCVAGAAERSSPVLLREVEFAKRTMEGPAQQKGFAGLWPGRERSVARNERVGRARVRVRAARHLDSNVCEEHNRRWLFELLNEGV